MTSENPTSSGGTPSGVFATTHWTAVLAAGQKHTPQADMALEELCRTYWYPLYAYVRRQGHLREDAEDLTQAVNGPFSADFRLVHLPAWPHGPIALSDAQSAVFRALWHFKGQPQTAETIMGRAGLGSEKPIDVFKVKKVNKGSPKYEGPHLAYQSLVNSSRTGEYVMPCAMLNPC